MFKKRNVDKELQKKLREWHKTNKKLLPHEYLGMTSKEFNNWCVSGEIPERFLK